MEPDDLTLEDAMKRVPMHTDSIGIGSFHPGGMNVAKASGRVTFLSNTIAEEELRAMLISNEK